MRAGARRIGTVVAIALLVSACALTRHRAVIASGTVYDALASMQDGEAALYATGQISAAAHKAFSAEMVKALEAGRAFNKAVQAWPHGTPAPASLNATVSDLFASANAAVGYLPATPATQKVIRQALDLGQLVTTTLLLGR